MGGRELQSACQSGMPVALPSLGRVLSWSRGGSAPRGEARSVRTEVRRAFSLWPLRLPLVSFMPCVVRCYLYFVFP